MKSVQFISILLLSIFFLNGCKKSSDINGSCKADDITTRTVLNKPAAISLQNNEYYIIEQGTIDTKLKPCNLSPAFQIDKLSVIISGEVKATIQNGLSPCCIENFIISDIK